MPDFVLPQRLSRGLSRPTGAAFALVIILITGTFGALVLNVRGLHDDAQNALRAERILGQSNAAERNLVDVETGLRGFLLTGREQFLVPYLRGLQEYREASRRLSAAVDPGGEEARLLAQTGTLTREWLVEAREAIAEERRGQPPSLPALRQRKAEMDRFRIDQAALVERSEVHRQELQDQASVVLLAIIAGLVALSAIAGFFMIERPATRRKRERREQAEFAETMQFAESEREAQALLAKELNRAIPGGTAVVFSRNNSENRLATATALGYAAPMFITILAIPLLGETVRIYRWSAVVIGFGATSCVL